MRARWGEEELARLETVGPSSPVATVEGVPIATQSGLAKNNAWATRNKNKNKNKLAARWGQEEIDRISKADSD